MKLNLEKLNVEQFALHAHLDLSLEGYEKLVSSTGYKDVIKASGWDDSFLYFGESYSRSKIRHTSWFRLTKPDDEGISILDGRYSKDREASISRNIPRTEVILSMLPEFVHDFSGYCAATLRFPIEEVTPAIPLPIRVDENSSELFDEIRGFRAVKHEDPFYSVVVDRPDDEDEPVVDFVISFTYESVLRETLPKEIVDWALKIAKQFLLAKEN